MAVFRVARPSLTGGCRRHKMSAHAVSYQCEAERKPLNHECLRTERLPENQSRMKNASCRFATQPKRLGHPDVASTMTLP